MEATKFMAGNYTSRRTGETTQRIIVKFDNGEELFLWCNLVEFADKDTKQCIEIIKKDRDNYLKKIIAATNEFGKQAQFSAITDVVEF